MATDLMAEWKALAEAGRRSGPPLLFRGDALHGDVVIHRSEFDDPPDSMTPPDWAYDDMRSGGTTEFCPQGCYWECEHR